MAEATDRTTNSVTALIAKSNVNDNASVVVWADPTTHRLLVDASVTISGLATAVTDGEAVDAADVGNLALGTDGTNYQILKTDSDGNLQIDVLTMPTVAVTGTFWQATQPVSLASVPSHAVTNAGTFVVQENGAALTALQLIDNLVLLEDAAHSDQDPGIQMLAIRDDTLNARSGAENDYEPLHTNANGALWVIDVNSAAALALLQTIDADTGNIVTSVQLLDDTIFVAGTDTYAEATSKGQLMLAVRRDADTTLANTTNEFTALQVDANGYLKVEIFDGGGSHTVDAAAGGLIIGDGTNPIVMLTDGADDVVNTNNQMIVAGMNYVFDGSGWDRTREVVNATNSTGGGIQAVGLIAQFDDTSPQTVTENQFGNLRMSAQGVLYVGGNVAHDGVDSGNPVKIGARAVDLGATPAAVAAADRTDLLAMRNGLQFVISGHPNTITKNLQVTDADGAQTDTDLLGAVAAGTALVVTKVSVTADNANTVDVSVRIGFGTANTPAADAAGVVLFHPGIAAGSGIVEGTGAGIIGIGASDQELRVTCEDPVTGSVSIVVTYFTISIG